NRSINETLSRTIITVLTTIFVVACLFFFGGRSLHTFSLVLLIGFIVGTYSSIFIAAAAVIDWNRISPHRFRL
ncbi:MAG: protein translocase subunit SecF, partial [Candidatus Omnitrophica bacterium]|nr:protein translocase subunit SecF [Candidatus Omnitrophota bacterium]